jgi:hypothetical protein
MTEALGRKGERRENGKEGRKEGRNRCRKRERDCKMTIENKENIRKERKKRIIKGKA